MNFHFTEQGGGGSFLGALRIAFAQFKSLKRISSS